MIDGLTKLIKNAHNRITNLIKLTYVSRFIEDNRDIPVVQVTYFGTVVGNATVILPYGTSAGLPENTLGILLNHLGDESNKLFIPISTTEREKNLVGGEKVVGNQIEKTYIKFDKDGKIIIQGKANVEINTSGDINIETSSVVNIKAVGSVNLDAAVVNVDATQTNLGTGGKKIALNGDSVVGGVIVATGTNTSI
jgi:hypothetical protein